MRNQKQSALAVTLFGIYMLLLTGVILFKLPFYSPEISNGTRVINFIPFRGSFDESGVLILREIIQNTLFFIPLGIYICMLKNRWSFIAKILSISSITLIFEVLQFIFALGISDITDILDNTLGGLIGIGIYASLHKIFGNMTYKIVTMFALAVTICVVLRFSHLFYLSHFSMMALPLLMPSSFLPTKIYINI